MSASLKVEPPLHEETARKAAALVRSLPVFPCREDKAPACRNGFKDAVRGEEDALALWRQCPGPLIGVPTGIISGFDVLDLDLQHATADEWYGEHCTQLSGHRMQRTRSGGVHLLFQHREGLRNSASKLARGVDVRADGGYIIWWPATGLEIIERVRPQLWPAWLIEALTPAPPPKADLSKIENGLKDADRYAVGALRAAVRAVAATGQGGRNDRLNAETFSLARFVPEGYLTVSQIAEAMAAAGLEAGLTPQEIQKTIASALKSRGVM
ncbi:hypothetical protein GOX01_08360 [Gluconobacter oxydans]|uniref:Bifunctional DNA primase/polymerase n=1 Tax=Gluconobacter oxydans TaxID=442 RepID=A0AB35AMD3_GLUOY|nr:bifunctional DNA primase/polymerase [Gluconobacter oxydans]KXV31238.1 recombinase RecA [Gluconobacter oxydans]MBF0856013.1 bifunctional DNA primase/polymerase [Gluconobacter oxydans]TCW27533.1 bifunctional DNA primase/polymerase-like protein [Gluconobacter oxydans]GEC60505.1 hypothetical protein GOX01_08360 [Gluconobacter oxydans]